MARACCQKWAPTLQARTEAFSPGTASGQPSRCTPLCADTGRVHLSATIGIGLLCSTAGTFCCSDCTALSSQQRGSQNPPAAALPPRQGRKHGRQVDDYCACRVQASIPDVPSCALRTVPAVTATADEGRQPHKTSLGMLQSTQQRAPQCAHAVACRLQGHLWGSSMPTRG